MRARAGAFTLTHVSTKTTTAYMITSDSTSMLNTIDALDLRRIGLSVIPVGGGRDGKAPLESWARWQDERPPESQIQLWAQRRPRAWAVIGGPVSNRCILDFDTAGNGPELMVSWGLEPHVKTPRGGYHVHVSAPAHPVRSQAWTNGEGPTAWGRRFSGLDVQSQGKYAVTLGRNHHGRYEVLRDLRDAVHWEDLPQELREALSESRLLERHNVAEHASRRAATSGARATRERGIPSDLRAPQSLVLAEVEGWQLGDQLSFAALPRDLRAGRNVAGFRFAKQCRDAGLSLGEAQQLVPRFVEHVNVGYRDGYRDHPYTLSECEASLRSAYSLVPSIERMRQARMGFPWRGKGPAVHEALLQRALQVGSTEFDMSTRDLAHAAGMRHGKSVTIWTRRFCSAGFVEMVHQSQSGKDRHATRWRLVERPDSLHSDHTQKPTTNTACAVTVQHSLSLHGWDAFRHGALGHCHDTLSVLASLDRAASTSELAIVREKSRQTIFRQLRRLEQYDLVSRDGRKWRANTADLRRQTRACRRTTRDTGQKRTGRQTLRTRATKVRLRASTAEVTSNSR